MGHSLKGPHLQGSNLAVEAHCKRKKHGVNLNNAQRKALSSRVSDETGGTVPTSGPPKEAWRNRCSGVVLRGNEADIGVRKVVEMRQPAMRFSAAKPRDNVAARPD